MLSFLLTPLGSRRFQLVCNYSNWSQSTQQLCSISFFVSDSSHWSYLKIICDVVFWFLCFIKELAQHSTQIYAKQVLSRLTFLCTRSASHCRLVASLFVVASPQEEGDLWLGWPTFLICRCSCSMLWSPKDNPNTNGGLRKICNSKPPSFQLKEEICSMHRLTKSSFNPFPQLQKGNWEVTLNTLIMNSLQ